MFRNRFYLRNVATIVVCLAGLTVFSGCKKDKDNDPDVGDNASKITATNVINSSSQIVTVKAQIHWHDDDYQCQDDVIAQAPYKDNGFTLELPATVSNKYLYLLAEEMPDVITISDKTVNAADIYIEAFDKDDNNIGGFYLTNNDESVYAMWYYVDKNVTIKGEYKEIYEEYDEEEIGKYDVDLKKGWNVVYWSWTESHNNSTGRDVYTYTMTSQKPSGVNLSWFFEDYYDSYAVSLKSAKSLSAKKPFFTKK